MLIVTPSVSIKDQSMEPCLIMLNACLTVKPSSSAQARSRFVRVHLGGEPLLVSKGRCFKSPERPGGMVSLRVRR
jgi:hypothetical protein